MENKKIKIIFYNNWHIGDIYFAQPFIKNVVENNINFDYYFFCHYSDFLYKSVIPNIKNIKDENDFLEIVKNMNNYNYENFIYLNEEKILLINTWLASMSYNWNKKQHILDDFKDYLKECDLISYTKCYDVLLSNILKEHHIQINYCNDIKLSFPVLPDLKIDYFLNFKKINKNKKIIFYYNYLQSSGQQLPVNNFEEHSYVIKTLAEDNIVILSNKTDYNNDNNDNIYFADDFLENEENEGNEENYNGKNLCYYAMIGYHSHISIYFDFGRCFMYANKKCIEENNENLRLHLAVNDYFYKSINNNLFVPDDYMKLVITNHYTDVIEKLKNILSFTKNTL